MLRPGLSLLLGLCVASLLPGTAGAHGCSPRSAAQLAVPARDVRRPDSGPGSAGPSPVRLHCCTSLALSLLLAALCLGRSLRRKAQRRPGEEKGWTRPACPRTCCLRDEGIGGQEENSASVRSFLRHLRQRCLRRGRSDSVWKDLDEEAALFSDGEIHIC